jgi:hypothetical protein
VINVQQTHVFGKKAELALRQKMRHFVLVPVRVKYRILRSTSANVAKLLAAGYSGPGCK